MNNDIKDYGTEVTARIPKNKVSKSVPYIYISVSISKNVLATLYIKEGNTMSQFPFCK